MIYTLLIPGLIWLILFAYLPMGGLSLAFKDYKANMGIWGSPWVGMENFSYVFRDPAFANAVWRTLYINFLKLLIQFPFPILLALMLNELRMRRASKLLQTVFTFPHFLSWIIVSGIVINVLSYDGLVNSTLALLGLPTINFLGSESTFVPMLLLTDIWKSTGWGAIIYLAAISGIDQDQYESAQIDGASRMQQMFRITLPNILPTVTVMFILSVGGLMSSGFDQIFNLANAATQNISEVLDVYIYRITFQSSTDFSFSTAVSLFRSLVNMILLLAADRAAKMMGGDGLFR
ncbi:ABC transporter permease [Paenibacillus sp. CN-4]|uniref:ABC transporter permease n=1 Tax=Paenibacillus nanchangensis TaxID=3348343 RepID=UPI00397E4CE2